MITNINVDHNKHGNKVDVNLDSFRRLYAEGLSDGGIGKALGISKFISRRVRSELGLAPNHKLRKRITVDPEEFKRLHAQGMTDGKIAEALGFSPQTAWKLRNKMGLPPQTKLLRFSETDETEFLKLYQRGKNTKEIASQLQVTYKYMYLWMKKYQHKFNRIRYIWKGRPLLIQQQFKWIKKHKKRLELYNKGLSDTQIAAELGEKKITILQWRRENNLPLPSIINETEFLKHYQQGKSTKEIASLFHVNYIYLLKWMTRHNYKANRQKYTRKTTNTRKTTKPSQKYLELEIRPEKQPDLFNRSISDTEIAAELEELNNILAQWRSRNNMWQNIRPGDPIDLINTKSRQVGFSLSDTILDSLNRIIKKTNSTYSEAVKNAISKYVSDYEKAEDFKGHHAGIATIVYNHKKSGLLDSLVKTQYQHSPSIKLSIPVYFGLDGCLESVVLDGEGEELKELVKAIKALNGVKFSELSAL
jgi:CopG family transcriptional regulator, nickel-responsive regulator